MAHCVLDYRGNYYDFNEMDLLDAMAIAWRLVQQDIDPRSLQHAPLARVMSHWQDYAAEQGGMGILNLPFDEWLADDDVAGEFVSFLNLTAKKFMTFGTHVPVSLVKSAVIQPVRYTKDPPIWRYLRALGELKTLIELGLKSVLLPKEYCLVFYRGSYCILHEDCLLDAMAMACRLLRRDIDPKSIDHPNFLSQMELWRKYSETTQAHRFPGFRILDPVLDEWLADDAVA